ncbi:MAG: DegT/DnrJ/EryC1/StrS family aminotransferase, partial [Halothece sp. Uz-M2-17]|nr:DegT/DnrJ/EryC1/StrS family aminotransferase [Halothece sp. Uz-M2-17]
CAQSFGAKYEADCVTCQQECSETMRFSQQGKFTGSIGDMGAFSFFPTKNLGAYGDGGLVVTDDDQLAESARMLRVHGERQKYHNEMLGYNSRLDALQAAILRVKLKYINQWNEQRRRVAKEYNERLSSVENIITPTLNKGHVFHQYTIRVLEGKRDQLRDSLSAAGIATMIYYPVSQDQLPVYEGQYEKLPVSEMLTQQVLSLPIWPELSTAKIDMITQLISNQFISSQ